MTMTSARKRRLADYTLDDWDRLEPVEGHRVELVDGQFRVNEAPVPRHQRKPREVKLPVGGSILVDVDQLAALPRR